MIVPFCAISAGTVVAIAVAIIAAIASVAAAIISGLFARSNNAAAKKLEAAQAEDNARITYSYEARKRLYTVCEPLLFQATEQAEEACSRIRRLAGSARIGHIRPDGSGWLDPATRSVAYYFNSIVYGLLAPITAFSILQRRLTTIDLSLDSEVRAKYEMLKLIFFSFQNDWELAAAGKPLLYDRNRSDPGEPEREELLSKFPQRYAPQGLYRVMTYVVAEAFVWTPGDPRHPNGTDFERCITFGEFEREWTEATQSRSSKMEPVYDTLVELFKGFHPRRKPVLWRCLLAQYLLHKSLVLGKPELVPFSPEDRAAFTWSDPGDEDGDHEETLSIAEDFVSAQLASLRERLAQP